MKYGLIGYPLSHSFSPGYFSEKFSMLGLEGYEYKAYSIANINEIESVFANKMSGLNVTIPYKEQVIPYLDELSNEAYEIGAINTIKIEGGRKVGYNTDVYGFEKSLCLQLADNRIANALVLGTGGAAKAVLFVLDKLGISYKSVSRSKGDILYDELTEYDIEKHRLIINTTPLGMYPNVDECPDIPYKALSEQHFLYDLVYNPEKTLFLKQGVAMGSNIKNGHDMLTFQAEKSWEIWNK